MVVLFFFYLYFHFFFFFLMIRRPPRSTLFSLHDALPIFRRLSVASFVVCSSVHLPRRWASALIWPSRRDSGQAIPATDRKSTRLNSSHVEISYAVFCLKKKKKK